MLEFFVYLNIQNCLTISQAQGGCNWKKKLRVCSKAHKMWQFCRFSSKKYLLRSHSEYRMLVTVFHIYGEFLLVFHEYSNTALLSGTVGKSVYMVSNLET